MEKNLTEKEARRAAYMKQIEEDRITMKEMRDEERSWKSQPGKKTPRGQLFFVIERCINDIRYYLNKPNNGTFDDDVAVYKALESIKAELQDDRGYIRNDIDNDKLLDNIGFFESDYVRDVYCLKDLVDYVSEGTDMLRGGPDIDWIRKRIGGMTYGEILIQLLVDGVEIELEKRGRRLLQAGKIGSIETLPTIVAQHLPADNAPAESGENPLLPSFGLSSNKQAHWGTVYTRLVGKKCLKKSEVTKLEFVYIMCAVGSQRFKQIQWHGATNALADIVRRKLQVDGVDRWEIAPMVFLNKNGKPLPSSFETTKSPCQNTQKIIDGIFDE